MTDDLKRYMNREQPLDAWLLDVMAIVNDIIYCLSLQLNQTMDGVFKDVS